jgi:hypothetical protein
LAWEEAVFGQLTPTDRKVGSDPVQDLLCLTDGIKKWWAKVLFALKASEPR